MNIKYKNSRNKGWNFISQDIDKIIAGTAISEKATAPELEQNNFLK